VEGERWRKEKGKKDAEGGNEGTLIRNLIFPEAKYSGLNKPPPLTYKSWKSPENLRTFLNLVEQKLRLRSTEDWYTVGYEQLVKFGGKFLHGTNFFSRLNWECLCCVDPGKLVRKRSFSDFLQKLKTDY
jgi:hypothetical protein